MALQKSLEVMDVTTATTAETVTMVTDHKTALMCLCFQRLSNATDTLVMVQMEQD